MRASDPASGSVTVSAVSEYFAGLQARIVAELEALDGRVFRSPKK